MASLHSRMIDLAGRHSPLFRIAPPTAGISKPFTSQRKGSGLRAGAYAVVVCVLLAAAATGAGLLIESYLHVPNILLVFVPVVLFVAVRFGFFAASFTSMLCVAATSYFTEPVYSFAVAETGNIWALIMFVVVSAYTSNLGTKIEQRVEAERRQNHVIGQLHAFSSRLAALSSLDEIAAEAVDQISRILRADLVLLVPQDGVLRPLPGGSDDPLVAAERLAAQASWEHRRAAGFGTELFPSASRLYRPLETGRTVVGVLGLRPIDGELDGELDDDETRLLDALSDQLAVSLDRARLAEEMHATTMLAETEKLRSALLTSVSHDLKTPLASVLGNVSSLRQYWKLYDESTRDEMLAFAENETLRLGQFVENFLQMTRIDAGALRPNLEEVDLSDLVGAALKRTEKQTAQHVVHTELPDDLPMVPLDFVLAEQVLVNLIDNAAKYSPPGSTITIAASAASAASAAGDHVRIDVLDEGSGIRDEDLKRLFERFFRAQAADHRRAGVGLGLAICKGFVEAMGGTIEAANRRDRRGALLSVSLPLAAKHRLGLPGEEAEP